MSLGEVLGIIIIVSGPIWIVIPGWRATQACHAAGRCTAYPIILLGSITAAAVCYSLTVVATACGFLEHTSLSRIGGPFWFMCSAAVVLSLLKIGSRPYGWIFGSSFVALFFWTFAISLH